MIRTPKHDNPSIDAIEAAVFSVTREFINFSGHVSRLSRNSLAFFGDPADLALLVDLSLGSICLLQSGRTLLMGSRNGANRSLPAA